MSARSDRGGGYARGGSRRGTGRFSTSYPYSSRSGNSSNSSDTRKDYDGESKSNIRYGRGPASPNRRGDRGLNYHHHSHHSSNRSSSSGRIVILADEPQLSTLLSKLEHTQDPDQCRRLCQQIKSITELTENKQLVARLSDQAFTAFDHALSISKGNRFLHDLLAFSIGRVALSLGSNTQRFFHWVLSKFSVASEASEQIKATCLEGLHMALTTDSGHLFAKFIPEVLDNLQRCLETVESPALLEPIVKCLVDIGKNYHMEMSQFFTNTVDILVGWHIDTSQEPALLEFISESLQSFSGFWIGDMRFTLDLLKQFLEDMEAYSIEMSGHGGLSQEEPSSPTQCMSKLIALIKVYTTVLKGIGDHFSPSRVSAITPPYIHDTIHRILTSISSATAILYSEELLIAANKCFYVMCKGVEIHFASSLEAVLDFVLNQFSDTDTYSEEHTYSASKLVLLMVEVLGTSVPSSFVQQVLAVDSPILQFRYSASSRLLNCLMKLYQTMFGVRNIPLLEVAYKLLIADIDSALMDLLKVMDSHQTTIERSESASSQNKRTLSPYEVQGAVIFDLVILSQLSTTAKSVMRMWSPKPSVHTIVTSHLATLTPALASEYPAIHYALLYTLFQDSQSHGHYVPGVATSVLVGSAALSLTDPNAPGSLSEVLLIITKQLELYTLPCDICSLIQKWVDRIIELLITENDKKRLQLNDLRPQLDSLAPQLLGLAFSREHSIRLETASLFKQLIHNQFISSDVIEKCIPEFLIRLTDTRGEIRAAYSTLLEVVPTCVLTSFARGKKVSVPKSGQKGIESLRSSYGTWLARKGHMTRPSQATFHGHHFKAIMGFILQGYAPSKHLPDDWLERMFHSCQHRQPAVPSSANENPETHPSLLVHMVGNCDAVLWYWSVYESAQYCVMARLKTPLGTPPDTFQVIESVLCGFAQEVEHQKAGKHSRDTPSSFSGHMGAGLGPRHYTVHLRIVLLLHFMEHLEKLMYNSYEGVSPMIFPTAPKPVRTFFRMNRVTCQEWLHRIRSNLVTIAIHAGMPALAVRNGYEALSELNLKNKGMQQVSVEFQKMLVSIVKALVSLGAWESIHGLAVWYQMRLGTKPLWIQGAEAQAKGSYEEACEYYNKALGLLHSSDEEDNDGIESLRSLQAVAVQFSVNELSECYAKVRDWREVVSWDARVETLKKQHPEMEGAFKVHVNIDQIKALSSFDTGDLAPARDFLDQTDTRRDPDVFPMWDPHQLLNASKTLLLQSVVSQSTGDGSGSDDGIGTADDNEYSSRSSLRRWLKLSSAFAESPIRVKALDWPICISPVHALQLQVTAALKAISPIQVRHHPASVSGLLLHSVPKKSLDPSCQDAGIWNDTFRYISHIQKYHSSTTETITGGHISSLLLESVRLARKQQNSKLARVLLRRHVLHLIRLPLNTDTDFSSAIINMNASNAVTPEDKLKVMREVAKLNNSSSQTPQAVENLTASITSLTASVAEGVMKRGNTSNLIKKISTEGNQLVARSLLNVVKWLTTDTRMLQSVWKTDTPSVQCLQTLLHMEEEVRSEGAGLFEGDHENWDLFTPEESKFDKSEFAMGQLLHLAAVHSPKLAKAWWNLAGWCYRIGRKNLETIGASGFADLQDHEKNSVLQIIPKAVSMDEYEAIFKIIGQVHAADGGSDDDLKLKEDVRNDKEDEVKVIKRQLLSACTSLEQMPSLDGLIIIWQSVRNRIFKHYQLAARAYFKFLQLSGSNPEATPGVDDMNVTATLRLLRLLVKYAVELKGELEIGFQSTPTKPWKGIIPQLFSRLSHPDANVRQNVLDLLCRIGIDSPHFIIYPAIVGFLKKNMADRRPGMSGLFGDTGTDSNFDSGVAENMGGDMYSPTNSSSQENTQSSEQDPGGEEDQRSASNLEKCHQMIVDSLASRNPTLVNEVKALVTELCRVTLLWDEMWLAALMQRQGEVYRRLLQIESEAKRTVSLNFLTHEEKQAILKKKYDSTMKPLIWLLEHLQAVTSQPPETNNERIFQATYQQIVANAIHTLKHPPNYTTPHSSWEPFKEFQQMLMHKSQKRMTSSISLHEVSPHLAAISSSNITLPGLENLGEEPVTLESFNLDVSVLPTKTKPKKISMIGSDGRKHTYLFKGLEDLHLDERIMQFMEIINNMFARAHKHQKQVYLARDYAVVPLGARSGLIQWIDSATPLFGLYKRWQQREAYANAQMKQQQFGPDGGHPPPIQIPKPNELFYSKIIPLLKKYGMTEQTPRKDWPHEVQHQVLKELIAETPKDLLARELWAASTCASEWWDITKTYTRSTAVMCIIGYIIGLGDRHLDNLLVEFSTGQMIHVDYNVCFEKGKSLRVPEKVPFRMTQNIESACGFTGVEGLFRLSCEEILKILRRGRETLLTLLEAFVYDPLIDWTHSEDAAFPLAVRAPSDASGLQSRKEMEKDVSEGLLTTRLAEMHPHWEKCRDSLSAVMSQLETNLDKVAYVGKQLCSYHSQMDSLEKQVELLQEALHSPSHPLISMQDRLTEQSKLKTDYDRISGILNEKYRDSQEWQKRHEDAFKMMQDNSYYELAAKFHYSCDIGMAGYEVAAYFLRTSGQGHTVEVCQQLDQDLVGQLQRRRALLNTCLEALTTYIQVVKHYPPYYVNQNRSYAWSMALKNVFDTNDLQSEDFSLAASEFEAKLSPCAPPKIALVINNHLRKHIQDLYTKSNKLGERLRSLNRQDINLLEDSVQESQATLKDFCKEFGLNGVLAMTGFLILSVAPLNKRWFFMEQTAYSAAEKLSELTSRDGDWFLDELCTMSGNVLQVVQVLEHCMQNIQGGPIKESSLLKCSVVVLREVHTVYTSLQELVGKFHGDLLTRCVDLLMVEDPLFMDKMNEILSVRIDSRPDLGINEIMNRLLNELKQSAMKDFSVDSTTAVMLQDVKTKFKAIINISPVDNEELPAGLKVFVDFMGAMEHVEELCADFFTALERIAAPVEWGQVDLFKDAEALMLSIPGSILYVELFFLRRTIALFDLCSEMRMLQKVMHVDILPNDEFPTLTPTTPPTSPVLGASKHSSHVPSENSLALCIRHYISDTLTSHLLGHPSHALSCIILSITHHLGINFENRPMTLDEICKTAHDHCQSQLPNTVIVQARQLYSSSDLAWREADKARRLFHNMEINREGLSRFTCLTTSFQWLHEESLNQPEIVHQWTGPQRSSTLIPLKKASSDQIINNVNAVREKVQSQHFRISQRLQWAAGANPSLNATLDDFERAVGKRNEALQAEEDLCNEIIDLCKTVIHLESTHSRTIIKTAYDKEIITLLNKGSEVYSQLLSCNEHLSKVSDIVPLIELPKNEPVTMSWMSLRLEELNGKRNKMNKEKKDANHKLAKHKEIILGDLEKLHTHNRNYRKLMAEIWQHLTTLGKLDPPLPMGQLQPGPRACISAQNHFSEGVREFIQRTKDLIASDLSLAKATLPDQDKIDQYCALRIMALKQRELVQWIICQLDSFVMHLYTPSMQHLPLKWDEPPEELKALVQDKFIASEASNDQSSRMYRTVQGVVRDPRTGKPLQEQNSHAVAVWRRVKAKLDGRDLDQSCRMSVSEQVDFVIQEAISLDNLCELYEGWTPWV